MSLYGTRYWKIRIFLGIYLGYIFYSLNRKCLAFAAPLLKSDLMLSNSDIGLIVTAWSMSYGVSKFINGILGDISNSRYFMSIGLLFVGLCNLCFALTSGLYVLACCWFVSGWFQGFGWPPCAKSLSVWFPTKERGRWWGAWNTCLNVSGMIAPLIFPFVADSFGWQSVFYFGAILAFLGMLFVFERLRDDPISVGLKPINPKPSVKRYIWTQWVSVLVRTVFLDINMWQLGLASCCVYIVRYGFHDWIIMYMMETKGYSYVVASSFLFWFEMGGLCGGLLCGVVSDLVFNGDRRKTNIMFSGAVSVVMMVMYLSRLSSVYALDLLVSFLCGVFTFGPQVLIGLTASEIAMVNAAASSTGFIGLFSYVGTSISGYPVGLLVESYGLGVLGLFLMSCSVVCLCLVAVPFRRWEPKGNG